MEKLSEKHDFGKRFGHWMKFTCILGFSYGNGRKFMGNLCIGFRIV